MKARYIIMSLALLMSMSLSAQKRDTTIVGDGFHYTGNWGPALKEAIEGAYSHKCTLSALQAHQHGIIVADEQAVGELKVSTYRYFKDIEKL